MLKDEKAGSGRSITLDKIKSGPTSPSDAASGPSSPRDIVLEADFRAQQLDIVPGGVFALKVFPLFLFDDSLLFFSLAMSPL